MLGTNEIPQTPTYKGIQGIEMKQFTFLGKGYAHMKAESPGYLRMLVVGGHATVLESFSKRGRIVAIIFS